MQKQGQDTISGIGQYHIDTAKTIRNFPAVPVESRPYNIDTATTHPTNTHNRAFPVQDTAYSQNEYNRSQNEYITFDTTKYFGKDSNPFGVRVCGKFYKDVCYKEHNWLLIQPLGFQQPKINIKESTWEKSIFVGGGIVARKMTSVIGIDIGRNGASLWTSVSWSEGGRFGLMSGLRLRF
jgi:hypothetical protein